MYKSRIESLRTSVPECVLRPMSNAAMNLTDYLLRTLSSSAVRTGFMIKTGGDRGDRSPSLSSHCFLQLDLFSYLFGEVPA